ncbi:MAG: hypothetical protein ACI4V7_12290 [Succinivibrionaceae bacterium]
MNITEQKCQYFIRHHKSLVIEEDTDYAKGYHVSWTKSRPVCDPDEILYVIKRCYVVAFTKQEAIDLLKEKPYNGVQYCEYIDIMNYVKAQTGKSLISMCSEYRDAFRMRDIAEHGISVVLYDVKDIDKIVTRTKREDKLKQAIDDRMSKRKLINTVFKPAIDDIAKKYGLEYDPDINCLTFEDPTNLYDFIDLVLKEIIAKDFARIGLQIDPRMERSKSINLMSKVIDLDKAEIVEVTSEE